MIAITLTQALVLYSLILLVTMIFIWVYTELGFRRSHRALGKQFLWRCVFCGFSYLDDEADRLSRCPRCHSFNDASDANAREAPLPAVQPAITTEPAVESRRNQSRRKRPGQRRRGPRRR